MRGVLLKVLPDSDGQRENGYYYSSKIGCVTKVYWVNWETNMCIIYLNYVSYWSVVKLYHKNWKGFCDGLKPYCIKLLVVLYILILL